MAAWPGSRRRVTTPRRQQPTLAAQARGARQHTAQRDMQLQTAKRAYPHMQVQGTRRGAFAATDQQPTRCFHFVIGDWHWALGRHWGLSPYVARGDCGFVRPRSSHVKSRANPRWNMKAARSVNHRHGALRLRCSVLQCRTAFYGVCPYAGPYVRCSYGVVSMRDVRSVPLWKIAPFDPPPPPILKFDLLVSKDRPGSGTSCGLCEVRVASLCATLQSRGS